MLPTFPWSRLPKAGEIRSRVGHRKPGVLADSFEQLGSKPTRVVPKARSLLSTIGERKVPKTLVISTPLIVSIFALGVLIYRGPQKSIEP